MELSREQRRDWLTGFLTVRQASEQLFSWTSTFSAAARDARRATGRDVITGIIERQDPAAGWLGTLGYLILLDQVGGCFAPRTLPRPAPLPNAFARALTYFAPAVTDTDIVTMYALRCAFAHDYALTNRHKNDRRLTHRFLIVDDPTAPLFEYPAVPWTGRYEDRQRSNQTRVNLQAVGDVTESVVASIAGLLKADDLVIVLPGGMDELLARFTLQQRP